MIGYSDNMNYDNIKISQSTPCPICKEMMRWSEIDEDITGDDKFRGVMDKLKHHLNNGCMRDSKLRELLTGELPPPWIKYFL